MYAVSQQLRIDFRDVRLSQPNNQGRCNEDILKIADGSNVPVPLLCGDITGHHGKTVYRTEYRHS